MDYVSLLPFAVIGLLALVSQWISWWLKVPAILFLLLAGIVLGPALGWLQPAHVFGDALIPMIQLSVAIILFEGSLSLKFDEWHEVASVVRNLTTIGVLITALLSAGFAYWIIGLDIRVCALLGAIISVTGPTVIVPILRSVRPKQRIANILRWEGILIDPIGAILAVLTFGLISALHQGESYLHVAGHFIELVLTGGLIGVVLGYGLGFALRRHWFPEYLQNIATLSIVVAAYSIANYADDGSGLLSVTIMGIFLANMKDTHIEDILDFKENLSIMLISGIFIILAARIDFHALRTYIFPAIGLFLTLQFIIRPFSVMLCTLGSDLNIREKIMLSWISPRGIVAAAVAALFAIRLQQMGIAGGHQLVLITFLMIIGTVVFQSLTASTVAGLLKVSEPERRGYLIIGANIVGRMIAVELIKQGFKVVIAGTNWTEIKAARMEGVEAYYGNAISEHADRHLDLVGVGNMLGLAPQSDINTLAAIKYRGEFGRNHVYVLQEKTDAAEKRTVVKRLQGKQLFEDGTTFTKLASLISQGATIHATKITKDFNYDTYLASHPHQVLPLFALDSKQRLHFLIKDLEFTPKPDWYIVGLVMKPKDEPAAS